jgi:deoxyribonuclease V
MPQKSIASIEISKLITGMDSRFLPKHLHSWDVTPTEAVEVQRRLRDKVVLQPFRRNPRLVAGADISFNKYSPTVYAAFVVLDYKSMKPVSFSSHVMNVDFPYVPGLLSFREIPPLVEAWKKLEIVPDVVILDGQGIAHPRGMGIASHFGVLTSIPTIGCAKSILTGKFQNLKETAGSVAPLMLRERQIGVVLRTKNKTNPVFVSPGHLMNFEDAVRITYHGAKGYRIPEPTRQAHLYVNELRRTALVNSVGRETGNEGLHFDS